MATPNPFDPDTLLTAAEVRALCGRISDMTLWRWVGLGIVPEPLVIERRRYWPRGKLLDALNAAGSRRAASHIEGQAA